MKLILVTSIISAQICWGAQTLEVKFEDLPKLLEKNQNLEGFKLSAAAADAKTGHLVRSYFPTLKGVIGEENFKTGTSDRVTQPYGSVEAKLNIFRGGKDSLEEDVREWQVELTHSQSKGKTLNLLNLARKIYWEMVHTRELVGHYEKATVENEKYLKLAERRVSRGLAAETDKLDFIINKSVINEEIESHNHELVLLQMKFAALLGLESDTQFKVTNKIAHDHDESFLKAETDVQKHPFVASLKSQQSIAGLQATQASRWWSPSVDLYGGYFLHTLRERDFADQGARTDTIFGIRLIMEFDGFSARADSKHFSLQSQSLEMQVRQQTREVASGIGVAKEELKHDHELIHFSEERIEQSSKYLARTLDEYNRGVKNSPDVLNASQKHLEFVKQYAQRRWHYQNTKAELLALLGKE